MIQMEAPLIFLYIAISQRFDETLVRPSLVFHGLQPIQVLESLEHLFRQKMNLFLIKEIPPPSLQRRFLWTSLNSVATSCEDIVLEHIIMIRHTFVIFSFWGVLNILNLLKFMVRFLLMQPKTHPCLSPQLGTSAYITFSWIYSRILQCYSFSNNRWHARW